MAANLLLVGCGKMGGALLAGWLDRGFDAAAITVVEPGESSIADDHRRSGVRLVASAEEAAAASVPHVVVFAVKPQAMDEIVPHYQRFVAGGPVFLSIAAGRTIASFETLLGSRAAVVRAMPNTPAAIRQGITAACANSAAGSDQRALCTELLEAVGEVVWIDDESRMDAVTALSGSGPAYVFLLAEAMAAAGRDAGLPADLAERLARATVTGAGGLLARSTEPAQVLRRNVTSPGGTTEAALEVLLAREGLAPLLAAAVRAATERSRALAR